MPNLSDDEKKFVYFWIIVFASAIGFWVIIVRFLYLILAKIF